LKIASPLFLQARSLPTIVGASLVKMFRDNLQQRLAVSRTFLHRRFLDNSPTNIERRMNRRLELFRTTGMGSLDAIPSGTSSIRSMNLVGMKLRVRLTGRTFAAGISSSSSQLLCSITLLPSS
jgi:hypothetical protein